MLWLTVFVSRSGELVTGNPWPDSEEFSPSRKDGAHRRQSSFLHNESVTGNPVFNNRLFSHSQRFDLKTNLSKWNKGIIDWCQTRVGGEREGKSWESDREEGCCFVTWGQVWGHPLVLESLFLTSSPGMTEHVFFILSHKKHMNRSLLV